MTATMFKQSFRMSRETFHWLLDYLEGLPELVPKNIGHGGRPPVALEKKLLLTLELLRNQIAFRYKRPLCILN